jgi:hypothetical protein
LNWYLTHNAPLCPSILASVIPGARIRADSESHAGAGKSKIAIK